MTAAILHPKQFSLALVEFVIADRGYLQPHHRQRFDGGLIVKHRRQKRAGADQVSGRDKNRVPGSLAELLDQRRHVFGAARRHIDLPGVVVGIGDPDPARRRQKIAVEIVDRENPQIDRRRSLRGRARGRSQHQKQRAREGWQKRRSHDFMIERPA